MIEVTLNMESNKYSNDFEKRLCCKLLKISEDSTLSVMKQKYEEFTANNGELAKRLYGKETSEKIIEFLDKNLSGVVVKEENTGIISGKKQTDESEEIRRIFKPTDEEKRDDELNYLISRYDTDNAPKKIERDNAVKKTKSLKRNNLMKKVITVLLVGGAIATITVSCNSNLFSKDKVNSQITYVDSENQIYEFEVACGSNENELDIARWFAKENPESNVDLKESYIKGRVKILVLTTNNKELADELNGVAERTFEEMSRQEEEEMYRAAEGSLKR